MRRTVRLGDLAARRVFWLDATRRYQVVHNMAPVGVVVRVFEERTVTIQGRTFKATRGRDEIWSAGAEVEIEVKAKRGASRATA